MLEIIVEFSNRIALNRKKKIVKYESMLVVLVLFCQSSKFSLVSQNGIGCINNFTFCLFFKVLNSFNYIWLFTPEETIRPKATSLKIVRIFKVPKLFLTLLMSFYIQLTAFWWFVDQKIRGSSLSKTDFLTIIYLYSILCIFLFAGFQFNHYLISWFFELSRLFFDFNFILFTFLTYKYRWFFRIVDIITCCHFYI